MNLIRRGLWMKVVKTNGSLTTATRSNSYRWTNWQVFKLSLDSIYSFTYFILVTNFWNMQNWECCTGAWTRKTMRTMRNCRRSEKQEVTVTWYLNVLSLIFALLFSNFSIHTRLYWVPWVGLNVTAAVNESLAHEEYNCLFDKIG